MATKAKDGGSTGVISQTILLCSKNLKLQSRSVVATATQVFIGIIFLSLIAIMQFSLENSGAFADFLQNLDPAEASIPAKPMPCIITADSPTKECFTFLYAPKGDAFADAIAAKVAATNDDIKGLDVTYGYKGFEDEDQIDKWLLNNANSSQVALIFHDDGESTRKRVSYTIQYNTTKNCKELGVLFCTDPVAELGLTYQKTVDAAILAHKGGLNDPTIDVRISDFPHPDTNFQIDFMRDFGPGFLYIMLTFNFVIQLTFVVGEKEMKLRECMGQMGLNSASYWMSWFLSCTITNVVCILFLTIFGIAINLDLFVDNEFPTYFVMFMLTTTSFTLFAFLLSTFLRTTNAARSAGILWFLLTFITDPILVLIYFGDGDPKSRSIIHGLSLIPGCSFFHGMSEIIGASSGESKRGMKWADIGTVQVSGGRFASECSDPVGGCLPWFSLDRVYISLIYQVLLFSFLTFYLDAVVPNEFGASKQPWHFIFNPNYWMGVPQKPAPVVATKHPDDPDVTDADVVEEDKAVASGNFGSRRPIVVLMHGLRKTFNGREYHYLYSNSLGFCLGIGLYWTLSGIMQGREIMAALTTGIVWFFIFKFVIPYNYSPKFKVIRGKKTEFRAVKGVSLAIEEDSLLVLLGHNGAGKTTTFNMLTGLMPANGGDATIFGMSIRNDMSLIQQSIGVCPQHDILWERLTGREHLELFSRLKNVPVGPGGLKAEIDARLEDVLLTEAADVQAGAYSGGMRRRLSLAIALLGDPKVVFLDEPTTGMDPVTRREVWNVIERAKAGRVIILTTHSMEEADILGDRVAIMAAGQLQALGTSLHLKNLFGGGFRLALLTESGTDSAKILSFVTERIKTAELVTDVSGSCLFRLPETDSQTLAAFFADVENNKAALGVTDFSVGQATLEDVFLNLSLSADEENDEKNERNQAEEMAALEAVYAENGGKRPKKDCCICLCPPGKGRGGFKAMACAKPNHHMDYGCCECCSSCCERDVLKAYKKGMVGTGNKLESDDIERSSAAGTVKQIQALLYKNATFQMRQKKLMACLILFPTMFILLCLLLQILVLDPINEDIIKQFDIPCLYNVTKITRYAAPELNVGLVSRANPVVRGGGGKTADNEWDFDMEQPSFNFYVTAKDATIKAVVGGLTPVVSAAASAVDTWHNTMMSASSDTLACAKVFRDSMRPVVAEIGDEPTEEAIKRSEDLEHVVVWQDWNVSINNAATAAIESEYGSSCQRNDADTEATGTPVSEGGAAADVQRFNEDGTPMKPTDADMWEVRGYQKIQERCLKDGRVAQLALFTGADAIKKTDTTAIPSVGSGIAQHIKLQKFPEPLLKTIQTAGAQIVGLMTSSQNNQKCMAAAAAIEAASVAGTSTTPAGKSGKSACEYVATDKAKGASSAYEQSAGLVGFPPQAKDYDNFDYDVTCTWTIVYGVGQVCGWVPLEVSKATYSHATDNWMTWMCDKVELGYPDDGSSANSAIQTKQAKDAKKIIFALASGLEIPSTDTFVSKLAAAHSFCAYYNYKDIVTKTKVTPLAGGVTEMNAKLFEEWGGKVIPDVTPKMMSSDYSAFHFYAADATAGKYDYRMWTNYSALAGQSFQGGWRNRLFEAPFDYETAQLQQTMGLMGRMNNAILNSHGLDLKIQTDAKTMPNFFNEENLGVLGRLSLGDFIARILMPYILLLYLFVIQGLIVFEKEAHLRDMMVMSGLKMQVYWLVQYIFYLSQYMVMIALLWITGAATGLRTFTLHEPGVLFAFFFVWGNLLVVFSLLITTLFSTPRTATAVCFLMMMIVVQCGSRLLDIIINQPGATEDQYLPYMWFPPMAMLRGLLWLCSAAIFDTQITFANWNDIGEGVIPKVLTWMTGEFFVCLLLLPVFESFCPTGGAGSRRAGGAKGEDQQDIEAGSDEPEDIKAERVRAETGNSGDSGEEMMIRTLNLRKTFAGGKKVAVKNLSFAVNKNECFGLLGHNGAGKSTTINMLCGLFGPTSGNAIIDGYRMSDNMTDIHKVMGVCPQDNVLWNDLTAAEHLRFYARLRSVSPRALDKAVGTALAAVNLHKWANVLSGKFSGGMKRRLSVACAMVGNPRIVYLDEPSTGLDPASRRKLWGVISAAKANKAVLLTTHSMEEAEVLCDRIGIMSDGVMKCLDIPAKLKQRYGEGYKLSIHTTDRSKEMAEKVIAFVARICPDAHLLNDPMGGTSDFELPQDSVKISEIYLEVDKMTQTLGILDWGITEATMEEVFLKVSHLDDPRNAGLKSVTSKE